eukprot:gb/GEZJ01001090.1/.p2 GENE.gb/GEZJ01001090.1/~~gb/GEZJ01001090.1/.p2  ORF type:complete len:181 (+),score=4.54 gb/GEZJ01001090.1/:497-1039(+)
MTAAARLAAAARHRSHRRKVYRKEDYSVRRNIPKKRSLGWRRRRRRHAYERCTVADVGLERARVERRHVEHGHPAVVLHNVPTLARVAPHGTRAVALVEEARSVLGVQASVSLSRQPARSAHKLSKRGASGVKGHFVTRRETSDVKQRATGALASRSRWLSGAKNGSDGEQSRALTRRSC